MELWLYYRYGFLYKSILLKKFILKMVLNHIKLIFFIFIHLEKFLKTKFTENSLFLPLYKYSDFL